jgi:hypothetical protein
MLIQLYCWALNTTNEPAKTQEQLVQALRDMRDVLLKESDWTQMPDSPLSEEVKNDWRIWRQEMRDITSNTPLPLEHTIQLPNPPESGRPLSWNNWDLNRGALPWNDVPQVIGEPTHGENTI